MDNDSNSRLEMISTAAQAYLHVSFDKRSQTEKEKLTLSLQTVEYRWMHTLRVSQFGRLIAENEIADVGILIPACLLHDIAWFDTNADTNRDHGRMGAKIAAPILINAGYFPYEIDQIGYAIESHVDNPNPSTLEARILSDADNIDRFGPYRILQWCLPEIIDYKKLVLKLSERVRRLEQYLEENPLFTPTGKQLFHEQVSLHIKFFSEFIGENKITIMPRI